MGIVSSIVGGIFSGTFGKMFSGILDYRNVKAGIEAGVLTEVIKSDIEINRMKKEMAIINREWWVTAWIMPAFAYPVAAHWGAVILDSIFHFGWKVAALPGVMAEWEGQIVLSFFIVGTAERVVTKWLNRGLVSSVITNIKSVFTGRGGSK